MFHLKVEAFWRVSCCWAILVEGDLVAHGGGQPVGDVSVAFTFSTQHSTSLSDEERLGFFLGVEQSEPSLCYRVA